MKCGVDLGSFGSNFQVAVADAHEEALEERAEQVPADAIWHGLVELTWLLEEIDVGKCFIDAVLDPFCCLCQLLRDSPFPERHVLEPSPELFDVQSSVGGEVDEALFLSFELAEFFAERFLFFLVRGLQRSQRTVDFVADRLKVIRIESFGGDDAGDCCFYVVQSNGAHSAESALLGGADVVLVGATVSLVLAVDESACATQVMAVGAVQHSAKKVEVDPVAIALTVAAVKNLLHGEEQFFGNDRLVPARVEPSFVAGHSRVERVAEDHRELAAGERTGGPLTGWPGGESLVFEHHLQLGDRVLVAGVLLKRPLDQRCANRVDVDGVHQSTVEVLSHIEVSELGAPDGAAPLHFVGHLDLDVLAAHPDLKFVDDVGDCFHGVAHVAVSEVLLCRDERDPLFAQLSLRDRGVEVVAEDA